jgi:hypothetical protein
VKVAAVVLALAVVGAFGVEELRELTQNRADAVVEGTETVLEVDVATRRYHGSDTDAMNALWGVCASTVSGTASGPTAVGPGDDGPWTITISPALGDHGRKRLVGCLEDATIDRIIGDVTSITSR